MADAARAKSVENDLLDIIKRRIREDGEISVAEYMELCLSHPEFGYYSTGKNVLGRAGDFTTSPEISQVFGELIGLWCAHLWKKMGAPNKISLVELGPGRGTLMADALRAVKVAQHFLDAARLHLVEINPALREAQREKLSAHNPTWHADLENLPKAPAIFIANEFFDAIPTEQIIFDGQSWRQRGIKQQQGHAALEFTLMGDEIDVGGIEDFLPDTPPREGDVLEFSPAQIELLRKVCSHIKSFGGTALLIDYGHLEAGFGDTLQALSNHQYADALQNPGAQDLTAHVNFHSLMKIAEQAGLHTMETTQGRFLENLGIKARLHKLQAGKDETLAQNLAAGVERLIAMDGMGSLFKVMAIYHPAQEKPEGFA